MDEYERRRLTRLNKEYGDPVFSSRRLFWMTVTCFVGVAMVAWALLWVQASNIQQ